MKYRVHLSLVALLGLMLVSSAAPLGAHTAENGRIVVEAEIGNGDNFQLVSVDPNNPDKPPVQITHLPPNQANINGMAPAFSPDGKKVAFIYQGPSDSGFNVYVIDIDGKHLQQLTTDNSALTVAWTPDGNRILLGDFNTKTSLSVLSTIRADGTGGQTFLTDDQFQSSGGSYTPDGRNIIYGSSRGGISVAAFSMNADGSNKQRLTDVSRVFCPTGISPDGKKVLIVPFCNNADVKPQNIWVMNIDGSGIRQLTNPGPHIVELPGVYSPDGKMIAFSSNRANPKGLFALWIADANGKHPQMLLKNAGFPTWGPAR